MVYDSICIVGSFPGRWPRALASSTLERDREGKSSRLGERGELEPSGGFRLHAWHGCQRRRKGER
jgi:hypothetical protein